MKRAATPRRWGVVAALAPALLMLVLLLVLPLVDMTAISFRLESFGQILPGFTAQNYRSLLGDPDNLALLAKTLGIAAGVTLLCAILAFPLAAAVASAPERWRGLLYFVVAAPLLVNTVVRSYGWLLILGRQGLANSLLMWTGLIREPLSLSGNMWGVVIGGTQVFLPFMVLSLTTSLQAIDRRLRESADILGAGPARSFITVTLPLSTPGLIAGSVLVFSMMLGAFVTPLMLGGSAVKYVSVQVYTDALVLFNLPRATALSLILTVVVLAAYAVHKRAIRRVEEALS
ncbi:MULTISPECIES: ABC transporter permease [unclassified Variovorax]|uniref:ABC transporter permease n=1 Tax=unclassified Variovorax TaxID=663243 RepID=UPI00257634D7|nr:MULTISPECIES: ABC transporter permease [unclassified Variovorax]MDM0091344.1 ABC transporter permease [Variovorax sp. J22G40]MDM0149429.1 ABC transporter permease [Variovorax sp. J2P1-31]